MFQYHCIRIESPEAFQDLIASLLSSVLLAVQTSVLQLGQHLGELLVHLLHSHPAPRQLLCQLLLLLPLLLKSFPSNKLVMWLFKKNSVTAIVFKYFYFFKLATRCKMSALINAEVHEVVKPSSVDKLLQLLCPSAEIFQPSLRVFNICLQIIIYILKWITPKAIFLFLWHFCV